MRNSKIITIEGRGEVTVREISPAGVYRSLKAENRKDEIFALLDDALTPPAKEIAEWYPSEIEQIIDGLIEVNSSFFGIARKLRVDGLIEEMVQTMRQGLPHLFADYLEQAMLESGTTDGSSL